MSETRYNMLDYKAPINETSFSEVIRDIGSRGMDVSNCSLADYQLKTLLSLAFVYGMHYDSVDVKERPLFLKTVFDEKIPALDISKRFCLHLLNNLETGSNHEFKTLTSLKYDLSNPLGHERLLDFVETDLMDIAESHRKWEFGRFVSENMLQSYFNKPTWVKLQNRTVSSQKKRDGFMDNLENQLSKDNTQLEPYESAFLKLMVKSKIAPKSTNIAEYLLVANIFQEKVFRLSLSTKKYTALLNTVISKTQSKQKGKGEQRL